MKEIYAELFNRIIIGGYARDARLKEEELAKEFDISRTPVRQALKQLEQDGLVEILPKRGARVIGLTVDDVEEIYDIRKTLEIQALRAAVPHIGLQGLIELRAAIQDISDTDDPVSHERLDVTIHDYFIQQSGKRRLIAMLNQLFRLIQRFRVLVFVDPKPRKLACDAHLALIDALSVRDEEAAVKILDEHLETSKMHAVAYIVKNPPMNNGN